MRRSTALIVAVYVTVALCWSGSWTFGKLGVGQVPPLELSAIRFGVAGVLMLAIAVALRVPLGLEKLWLIVVAGFFGIFAYNALVFVGLTISPASDGALIVPTINPVLTVLFAAFIGERITTTKIVGVAIATVGAAVVIGAATGLSFTGDRLVGDLLMLAGAAAWSAYATIGAVTTRHGSPLGVTAIASLSGAAMLFPLGFLEHGYADVPSWPVSAWLDIAYLVVFATIGAVTTRHGSPLGVTAIASLSGAAMLFPLGFLEHGYADVPSWPVSAWLDIAYLVVFATIIGFVLFYWAVRRYGAGMASMVSYLVPIFALVQAVLILGEQPAPLEIVGGAIILGGVRVATLRFTPRSPMEETEPA